MSDRSQQLRAQLIRNFDSAPTVREQRAPLYDTLCARLASGTAARKIGASIDIVAPGMRACPYHFHHAQEELFVILEGTGQLRVAGEMLALVAGDVVFIPPGPDFAHQIINDSAEPLKYLSVSTRDSPELVEYPDSGKYLAWSSASGGDVLRMHRSADALDYWDGEA